MDHQLSTLRELVETPIDQLLEKRLLQQNFLKLNIYSDSLKGIMVSETFSYPFANFLSEVGGIMGLYLGILQLIINLSTGTCLLHRICVLLYK